MVDASQASQITSYNYECADGLHPLADFTTLPEDLFAIPLANGDIALRYSGGEEAAFDVIGVIIGCTLESSPGHARYVPFTIHNGLTDLAQGRRFLFFADG